MVVKFPEDRGWDVEYAANAKYLTIRNNKRNAEKEKEKRKKKLKNRNKNIIYIYIYIFGGRDAILYDELCIVDNSPGTCRFA